MTQQAERSYRWLFWCLVLIGFTLDQATKYGVFRWLYNGGEFSQVDVIPGVFHLSVKFLTGHTDDGGGAVGVLRTMGGDTLPYVNTGALFGLGRNANFLFALVSIGAAVAILAWSARPASKRELYLSVALGLILAGTLGNLYDRVVFSGVRDFLYWDYLVDWPVFNLADCFLVCGAFLLLAQAFLTQPAPLRHALPADSVVRPEVAEAK
jgi:lipoprotein signal peptidase